MSAVGKTPIGLKFNRISSHTPKNIQEGIADIICEDIDILSHPKASARYVRNKVEELKDAQPGKVFGVLKSMGAQPGDCSEQEFSLPNHQGLTDEQCAERIAQHFASISSEYSPLDIRRLPERARLRLRDETKPPLITEYECYLKIKRAKKPRSVIPGDLPSKVIKEFSVELAKPLYKLLNNIITTSVWPEQYKVEHVTPISKVPVPQSEDDLRPISMTPFFSKIMEQFIVEWLLEFVGPKLDFRQYGGTRGNSISHYLIEFLNFILHQQEMESVAVLACLVDFSKAFNRQDHNILITKLSDLGVPGWLLRLVVAFLTNRRMRVKYKGKYSSLFSLPGGGPQGTLLGLFLFLILVNDVGFAGQKNNVGDQITKKKVKELNQIHLKYVDDLSIAESIDMNTQLSYIPVHSRPQPDMYRARTGHILNLQESKIYKQLKETQEYAESNKMKINASKTKLILFNPCKTKDFMPDIELKGTRIDVVEKTKLLGVIISSNLSWSANTQYIVERCSKKTWVLRRLKYLGATHEDLLDVYCKQIRIIAEFAVPVWNSSLTGDDVVKLERIQKIAFNIILGDEYLSYTNALKLLGMQKLSERRKYLCLKFAKKSLKSEKFSTWFKSRMPNLKTRTENTEFCNVISRTMRFEKSPISYLTNLLNIHYGKRR